MNNQETQGATYDVNPCPFCGSSSIEVEEADRDCHKYWLRVRCIMCNATGPVCGRFKGDATEPMQETIRAWNKQIDHEDAESYREMMAVWDSRNESHCYASVYDEIVAQRKAMGVPMAVGKHTAANSKYCKETIEALQATGHHSAADWAIWMLWWRMMDWTTAKQVDEMRVQEIAELRQRIGIGPDDPYA